MAWLSLWWVWVSAALLLGMIEILAPGFIFLGFALAALALAAMAGLGILPGTVPVTLALFAGLALLAWIVLRRSFKAPGGNVKTFVDDINDP